MKGVGAEAVITSRDVARVAGVAQSTVSYVMSGKRPISEKTRKRVEAAIEELTYQPNAGARALASKRTAVIAMVVPFGAHTENADVIPFLETVTQSVREHDYDLLLVTSDEGPSVLTRLEGRSLCDGIVIMSIEDKDARVPVAASLHVPTVLIGVPADPKGLACVDVDFGLAGRMAVEELLSTGHDRIVLLGYSAGVVARGINYVRRFQEGVEAASSGVSYEFISPVEPTRLSAADAVARALSGGGQRIGLVVADSTALPFVVRALQDAGRIPGRDVSVVAVATDAVATAHEPEVTNISLEPHAVSRRAMAALFARLGDEGAGTKPAIEFVAPRLTRRATTVTF